MGILFKNGTVVTSTAMFQADVRIQGEKITEVGQDLCMKDDQVEDMSGKYILPGAIDLHTHMSDPFGGTVSSDSEFTGTRAAACGGVTTVFDFAKQKKGMHLAEAVDIKKKAYENQACVDYALHCIVTDLMEDDQVLEEFADLVKDGVNTFKCYSVYKKEGIMVDNQQFAAILEQAGKVGGMATLHAEDAGVVDYLTEKYVKEGKLSPWYHYMSRPEWAAAQADISAIHMAMHLHAPLYIVHMDNKEGVEAAAKAKMEGYPVFVETCPQYLEFTSEVYKREDAVKYVISPAIKNEESREALWNALRTGVIDTVATDHCPFTTEEKNWGKDDFTKIPNGCGGIENRYPYLLSAAHDGRLTYERVVQVCAENPAKIFGCSQKGSIQVGKDADLVIYDPQMTVTGGPDIMHTACDHSIWDGYEYHGYPVQTYLRGKLVAEHGIYIGQAGDGRFVKRSPLHV